jgi:hypothetical protein
MGLIIEKTRGQLSRGTVPLNTCLQCSFILSTNPHEWMDNSKRSTGVLIINLGILDLLLPFCTVLCTVVCPTYFLHYESDDIFGVTSPFGYPSASHDVQRATDRRRAADF